MPAVTKSPKHPVLQNDVVVIAFPAVRNETEIKAENFDYKILFEDCDILVIDKPAGVVVHPASGNYEGTVVNALIGRDSSFKDKFSDEDDLLAAQRPGIVHRLDKDTSGCLIIAKNAVVKSKLSTMFAERKVTKTYYALTYGVPAEESGKLETLIGRHPVNRKKMSVVEKNGKMAITLYKVLKAGEVNGVKVALLKVNILTGRTHQIRVHMASIKSPILGDQVYGGNQKIDIPRQMLHAGEISFLHPITGETLKIISQYPEDFQQILQQL